VITVTLGLGFRVCRGGFNGGHSCSGRRGPWEAGPWRPPGLGGPGRL